MLYNKKGSLYLDLLISILSATISTNEKLKRLLVLKMWIKSHFKTHFSVQMYHLKQRTVFCVFKCEIFFSTAAADSWLSIVKPLKFCKNHFCETRQSFSDRWNNHLSDGWMKRFRGGLNGRLRREKNTVIGKKKQKRDGQAWERTRGKRGWGILERKRKREETYGHE